jgi:tetratricopeptide (TPR) repeat protein
MVTRKREEALANYNRALAISEKLESVIEAEDITSDGKAGRATARELGRAAWYALLARDYAKALAAADRALSITPNELWIETNRAHALMFLGRTREAMALYMAHKGERVAANKPWQQVIAEDFAILRRAGLSNPLMPKIERALGAHSK